MEFNEGLKNPNYQLPKYSYSNITDSLIDDTLFAGTYATAAGNRLRAGGASEKKFLLGAFDIGWEGYSFDSVDEIVSTGHLLKLINDKIEKISGGSQESITEHANKKATTTVLGHNYITDSITLTSITEANRSYTAASIKALDALHNAIASEYKQYISDTVLGGEVTEDSLDTIKELSEWITSHGEQAADLVSQFNEHEKLNADKTTLGHVYLTGTNEFGSIIHPSYTAVSVPLFVSYIKTQVDILNSDITTAKQAAYTYAKQIATRMLDDAYTYAYSQALNYHNIAKQAAYSYAANAVLNAKNASYAYTNQMIEVAFAWQII